MSIKCLRLVFFWASVYLFALPAAQLTDSLIQAALGVLHLRSSNSRDLVSWRGNMKASGFYAVMKATHEIYAPFCTAEPRRNDRREIDTYIASNCMNYAHYPLYHLIDCDYSAPRYSASDKTTTAVTFLSRSHQLLKYSLSSLTESRHLGLIAEIYSILPSSPPPHPHRFDAPIRRRQSAPGLVSLSRRPERRSASRLRTVHRSLRGSFPWSRPSRRPVRRV